MPRKMTEPAELSVLVSVPRASEPTRVGSMPY